MMPPILDLKFHHLGLATRNPDETGRMLRGLGYSIADPIFDPLQNVHLIWCAHDSMPAIEVVYPSDDPGPLDTYLAEFPELIYHLCYVAKDIQSSVDAMKSAGLRVLPVSAPKPAVLFDGRQVGFYMARGIGLIEILEET
jgi:methylmalonyl-CoA/ethylmalonyl-CoA epimerase